MRFVDDQNQYHPNAPVELDPPNLRLIHTRYGPDIRLERRDPYGFIYVVWWKGPTPEILSGAYDTFDRARAAVTHYMDNNTFNNIVDEQVAKPEPLRFKKVKKQE